MMNIFRISCIAITSRLSVSTPKKGNKNPFIILFSTFHTNRRSIPYYVFEDITDLDEAVTLFNKMIQIKPMFPIQDFNKLLNIIVKMKHYSQVIVLYKKMSLLGCPVNEFIMSTVINCYCNLKKGELGFAVVASFLKRGYAPDTAVVNCLIKGLFLEGSVAKAVHFFKKVIRYELCEVNEVTISIMMDGLCKSGNVGVAVELLEIAEDKKWKVNVVVYTAVLDGLCKGGMVKEAMTLLFRMIDRGIVPDVVTYTSFIHGLCKDKKLDLARTIFNDLPSKMISPNVITYTVMIQGLCQEGIFCEAKEMLEKMERVGCFPDSVTYNIIIQSCLKHRDSNHSLNLFNLIVERDFQLDARTFFMLLCRMKAIYGGVTINSLIQILISSATRHRVLDRIDDVMIKSLTQKLISSLNRFFKE